MYVRHQLGKATEDLAKQWFLSQPDYRHLESNFRCRWGEIDLIFEQRLDEGQNWELVFVEVRARSDGSWVSPLQSVDWKKQKRLKKTADYFLSRYEGPARSMRFDLIYREGSSWGHLPNLLLS